MIFQSKFDRSIKLQKEKNAGRESALEDTELAQKIEKGDTTALVLSALLVIVPVTLIALVVIAAAGYFFIIR